MDKEERREKEKDEKIKKKKKSKGNLDFFTISIQTFFKTTPTPPEEPLHQRSQSRSPFQWSRSPPKQALSFECSMRATQ
jgi:hypothetical protein